MGVKEVQAQALPEVVVFSVPFEAGAAHAAGLVSIGVDGCGHGLDVGLQIGQRVLAVARGGAAIVRGLDDPFRLIDDVVAEDALVALEGLADGDDRIVDEAVAGGCVRDHIIVGPARVGGVAHVKAGEAEIELHALG
jgi:hypothetical protein